MLVPEVTCPTSRWLFLPAEGWGAGDFVPAPLIQMNLNLYPDMSVCRAKPAVADFVRQLNMHLILPLQSVLHRLQKGWQFVVEE